MKSSSFQFAQSPSVTIPDTFTYTFGKAAKSYVSTHSRLYADALLPITNDVVFNEWLGNVVNDERLVWELRYEFLGYLQMFWVD